MEYTIKIISLCVILSVAAGMPFKDFNCSFFDHITTDLEKIGNRCYHFVTMKKTWNSATKHCNDLGMRLVSIGDYEEMQALEEYIRSFGFHPARFWTSGNNLRGPWMWSTKTSSGIPFWWTYTPWLEGEPDNHNLIFGQHCVEIQHRGFEVGLNDCCCYTSLPSICQA